MSLEKAIAHGKEHRRPRRSPDASCYDRTPRNGCAYCQENRTYQARREEERTRYEWREALDELPLDILAAEALADYLMGRTRRLP